MDLLTTCLFVTIKQQIWLFIFLLRSHLCNGILKALKSLAVERPEDTADVQTNYWLCLVYLTESS
jgi:hypothetical protein